MLNSESRTSALGGVGAMNVYGFFLGADLALEGGRNKLLFSRATLHCACSCVHLSLNGLLQSIFFLPGRVGRKGFILFSYFTSPGISRQYVLPRVKELTSSLAHSTNEHSQLDHMLQQESSVSYIQHPVPQAVALAVTIFHYEVSPSSII